MWRGAADRTAALGGGVRDMHITAGVLVRLLELPAGVYEVMVRPEGGRAGWYRLASEHLPLARDLLDREAVLHWFGARSTPGGRWSRSTSAWSGSAPG
jgi:hypothetical protein